MQYFTSKELIIELNKIGCTVNEQTILDMQNSGCITPVEIDNETSYYEEDIVNSFQSSYDKFISKNNQVSTVAMDDPDIVIPSGWSYVAGTIVGLNEKEQTISFISDIQCCSQDFSEVPPDIGISREIRCITYCNPASIDNLASLQKRLSNDNLDSVRRFYHVPLDGFDARIPANTKLTKIGETLKDGKTITWFVPTEMLDRYTFDKRTYPGINFKNELCEGLSLQSFARKMGCDERTIELMVKEGFLGTLKNSQGIMLYQDTTIAAFEEQRAAFDKYMSGTYSETGYSYEDATHKINEDEIPQEEVDLDEKTEDDDNQETINEEAEKGSNKKRNKRKKNNHETIDSAQTDAERSARLATIEAEKRAADASRIIEHNNEVHKRGEFADQYASNKKSTNESQIGSDVGTQYPRENSERYQQRVEEEKRRQQAQDRYEAQKREEYKTVQERQETIHEQYDSEQEKLRNKKSIGHAGVDYSGKEKHEAAIEKSDSNAKSVTPLYSTPIINDSSSDQSTKRTATRDSSPSTTVADKSSRHQSADSEPYKPDKVSPTQSYTPKEQPSSATRSSASSTPVVKRHSYAQPEDDETYTDKDYNAAQKRQRDIHEQYDNEQEKLRNKKSIGHAGVDYSGKEEHEAALNKTDPTTKSAHATYSTPIVSNPSSDQSTKRTATKDGTPSIPIVKKPSHYQPTDSGTYKTDKSSPTQSNASKEQPRTATRGNSPSTPVAGNPSRSQPVKNINQSDAWESKASQDEDRTKSYGKTDPSRTNRPTVAQPVMAGASPSGNKKYDTHQKGPQKSSDNTTHLGSAAEMKGAQTNTANKGSSTQSNASKEQPKTTTRRNSPSTPVAERSSRSQPIKNINPSDAWEPKASRDEDRTKSYGKTDPSRTNRPTVAQPVMAGASPSGNIKYDTPKKGPQKSSKGTTHLGSAAEMKGAQRSADNSRFSTQPGASKEQQGATINNGTQSTPVAKRYVRSQPANNVGSPNTWAPKANQKADHAKSSTSPDKTKSSRTKKPIIAQTAMASALAAGAIKYATKNKSVPSQTGSQKNSRSTTTHLGSAAKMQVAQTNAGNATQKNTRPVIHANSGRPIRKYEKTPSGTVAKAQVFKSAVQNAKIGTIRIGKGSSIGDSSINSQNTKIKKITVKTANKQTMYTRSKARLTKQRMTSTGSYVANGDHNRSKWMYRAIQGESRIPFTNFELLKSRKNGYGSTFGSSVNSALRELAPKEKAQLVQSFKSSIKISGSINKQLGRYVIQQLKLRESESGQGYMTIKVYTAWVTSALGVVEAKGAAKYRIDKAGFRAIGNGALYKSASTILTAEGIKFSNVDFSSSTSIMVFKARLSEYGRKNGLGSIGRMSKKELNKLLTGNLSQKQRDIVLMALNLKNMGTLNSEAFTNALKGFGINIAVNLRDNRSISNAMKALTTYFTKQGLPDLNKMSDKQFKIFIKGLKGKNKDAAERYADLRGIYRKNKSGIKNARRKQKHSLAMLGRRLLGQADAVQGALLVTNGLRSASTALRAAKLAAALSGKAMYRATRIATFLPKVAAKSVLKHQLTKPNSIASKYVKSDFHTRKVNKRNARSEKIKNIKERLNVKKRITNRFNNTKVGKRFNVLSKGAKKLKEKAQSTMIARVGRLIAKPFMKIFAFMSGLKVVLLKVAAVIAGVIGVIILICCAASLISAIASSGGIINGMWYSKDDDSACDMSSSISKKVFDDLLKNDQDWFDEINELAKGSPGVLGYYDPNARAIHTISSYGFTKITPEGEEIKTGIDITYTDGSGKEIIASSNAKAIMSLAHVYMQADYSFTRHDNYKEYCQDLWGASHSYDFHIGTRHPCEIGCDTFNYHCNVTSDYSAIGAPLCIIDGDTTTSEKTTALNPYKTKGCIQCFVAFHPDGTCESFGFNSAKVNVGGVECLYCPGHYMHRDAASGTDVACDNLVQNGTRTISTQTSINCNDTYYCDGTTGKTDTGYVEINETVSLSCDHRFYYQEIVDGTPVPHYYCLGHVDPACTNTHTENITFPDANVRQIRYCSGCTRTIENSEQVPKYECGGHCSGHTATICLGHVDLKVSAKIVGINNNLFAIDPHGAETYGTFEGWFTDDGKDKDGNQSWARAVYEQDWYTIYGLLISSDGSVASLSDENIKGIMDEYASDTSVDRKAILSFALGSVGKIPYYYGGYATGPGYDGNDFGLPAAEPDHKGRTLKGLDCSHWVDWVYWSTKSNNLGNGNTSTLKNKGVGIYDPDKLQPGDILVVAGVSNAHAGMFIGWTDSGQMIYIEEAPDDVQITIGNFFNEITDGNTYWRNVLGDAPT